MRNTPNYNLPQYDGTDKFTKEVLNDAFGKLDTAISDLQETFNITSTGGTLTTQEVINARNGKQNLKERIDEIDEQYKDIVTNDIPQITGKMEDIDLLKASKLEVNFLSSQITDNSKKIEGVELNKANRDEIGLATQTQVNEWLTKNPQATTTVTDKSITFEKLNDELSVNFDKVYTQLSPGFVSNTWIRQGNYYEAQNNFKTAKITVIEGEEYRISGYILSNQRLYLCRNEADLDRTNGGGADGLLQYLPNGQTTTSWTFVENMVFKIPSGGKYLYVCTPTASDKVGFFKLEKLTSYKVKQGNDFTSEIKSLNQEIEFLKNNVVLEQKKNDFAWGNPDKLYVTFCFDDSLADVSDIETFFEQKGVPCCFATIPQRLNNVTNSGETVKQVLQRAIANGGEVLSHWATPLLPTSTDEDYYNVYVGAKKMLTNEGFDVNGIITSGGGEFNLQNWNKDILLARPYYRYADLTDFNNTGVEQYLSRRCFITTDNTTNKANIDTFIEKGQLNRGGDLAYYGKYRWLPLASHGISDGITTTILGELIDYIKTKPNVQIVSYKYLFDRFSSTKLEKRLLTLENK